MRAAVYERTGPSRDVLRRAELANPVPQAGQGVRRSRIAAVHDLVEQDRAQGNVVLQIE